MPSFGVSTPTLGRIFEACVRETISRTAGKSSYRSCIAMPSPCGFYTSMRASSEVCGADTGQVLTLNTSQVTGRFSLHCDRDTLIEALEKLLKIESIMLTSIKNSFTSKDARSDLDEPWKLMPRGGWDILELEKGNCLFFQDREISKARYSAVLLSCKIATFLRKLVLDSLPAGVFLDFTKSQQEDIAKGSACPYPGSPRIGSR